MISISLTTPSSKNTGRTLLLRQSYDSPTSFADAPDPRHSSPFIDENLPTTKDEFRASLRTLHREESPERPAIEARRRRVSPRANQTPCGSFELRLQPLLSSFPYHQRPPKTSSLFPSSLPFPLLFASPFKTMSSNPSTSVPAVVSEPAPVSAHSPNKITQAELEKHAEIKDMWLLISGKGQYTSSLSFVCS